MSFVSSRYVELECFGCDVKEKKTELFRTLTRKFNPVCVMCCDTLENIAVWARVCMRVSEWERRKPGMRVWSGYGLNSLETRDRKLFIISRIKHSKIRCNNLKVLAWWCFYAWYARFSILLKAFLKTIVIHILWKCLSFH